MKKLFIYILTIATLLTALTHTAQGQIIQFSQFYAAPLYLAPSYAGDCFGSRVSLNYRNQWPEVGTFNTYAIAYDQNLHKLNSGVGLMVLRDEAGAGALALTVIDICYSWWTQINRTWIVRPGIGFKYNQRSVDFEKLIFGDMINELGLVANATTETPPLSHKPFLDAQVSCIASSDKYWGGLSIDHLFRPRASLYDDDSYRENMKVSLSGGAKIYIGAPQTRPRGRQSKQDLQSVTFTLLYDFTSQADNLSIGTYWHKDPFTLGCWLRGIPVAVRAESYSNLDAITIMLGYKIFNFHIGYSYDFTVGHLLSSTGGSHELSVQYEFQPKARSKKRHSVIACPRL
ncbi:MAG: PorP/SprF family type IX secretion system membrane protein [Bacteroidales bacterium]|nr:PorP/SprF family type IX secretion system membrane protein [Bacteroidales bacterium]